MFLRTVTKGSVTLNLLISAPLRSPQRPGFGAGGGLPMRWLCLGPRAGRPRAWLSRCPGRGAVPAPLTLQPRLAAPTHVGSPGPPSPSWASVFGIWGCPFFSFKFTSSKRRVTEFEAKGARSHGPRSLCLCPQSAHTAPPLLDLCPLKGRK